MNESKMQALADEFTAKVMTELYGSRFTELDNLEDDKELSEVWDEYNCAFYAAMDVMNH